MHYSKKKIVLTWVKSLREINVLLVPFQDPSNQSIKLHFYRLVLKWCHLLISFLLFYVTLVTGRVFFVIIVFLLLLFINDIDSLWFAFLCFVFLYCLSWNPWSANYSEVQKLKLSNPMFSSQALQFNNTISVSISPLKKKNLIFVTYILILHSGGYDL